MIGAWQGKTTSGDGTSQISKLTCLRWAPNNNFVAAGCGNGAIILLDVARSSPGWVGAGFQMAYILTGIYIYIYNIYIIADIL